MVDSHSIQKTKLEGESASINLKIYKLKPIGLTFDQNQSRSNIQQASRIQNTIMTYLENKDILHFVKFILPNNVFCTLN